MPISPRLGHRFFRPIRHLLDRHLLRPLPYHSLHGNLLYYKSLIRIARAGDPSEPASFRGRQARKYSPGSTSVSTRPSRITTSAPSSVWWVLNSPSSNGSTER